MLNYNCTTLLFQSKCQILGLGICQLKQILKFLHHQMIFDKYLLLFLPNHCPGGNYLWVRLKVIIFSVGIMTIVDTQPVSLNNLFNSGIKVIRLWSERLKLLKLPPCCQKLKIPHIGLYLTGFQEGFG